jgi:lipid-A-disaccharide synthase
MGKREKHPNTLLHIAPNSLKENRITDIKKRSINVCYFTRKTFYEDKHNFPVEFVGHPLIDAIHNHPIVDSTKFRIENLDDKPLSPYFGSRKQEPKCFVMLSIVEDFPDYQFVIAGAPSQEFSFMKVL